MTKQIPANEERFRRLLDFCTEIISICQSIQIEPFVTGSLAVFAHTRDPAIDVNDIDLVCSEADFTRLMTTLEGGGISCELKEWHVLQVRRGDLKVEFDSIDHRMKDLPFELDHVEIAGEQMRILDLASLTEVYRRGVESTASEVDDINRWNHKRWNERYQHLLSFAATQ